MKINEILTEKWSQKYKGSINCSHPRGFSQKAHCAGKKKTNESTETPVMEMTCPDCGMCQSHGNLNEIAKGAKDSNGVTKCWPGKHAEGTKKGKNGGQVRNCVPNESQGVAEGLLNEFKADDFGDDEEDDEEDDFPEMFEAPFTAVINGKKQNGTVIIYPGEVTSAEWHLKDTIYIKTGMDNVHDTSDFITHAAEYIQEIIKLDGRGHNYVKHLKKRRGVAEGEKHGLYYNVNKRKAAGTSRPASSPKAPTAQAWKDAAKTAKNEGVTEAHDAAAKEIHGNLFHNSIPPGAEKHHFSAVLKAHGLKDTDAKDVINRVRKMGYSGSRLDKSEVAEGSELKQAKRKYNQAAKDANLDQVGAGKKIDTMKKSLRQKDVDNKKEIEEDLEAQFDMIEDMVESLAQARGVDAEQIWEDLEAFDDETLLNESAAWHRKAGKSAKGGLNRKGVASYRAEHPGSKLQMAVTTKPSKLKHGSKAAKRRKSFCARMGGVKGPMKKPNGKPTRKALALRKWNC